MANLEIILQNDRGGVMSRTAGEDELWMLYDKAYQPGDTLVFAAGEVPGFYVIRADSGLDEAYVYLTARTVEFAIPGEPDRMAYPPAAFAGERHYITMRRARSEENRNYRNLAKNVMDRRGLAGCFPHVHANAETQGPIAPVFAARGAIDGVVANTGHWPWPFQSWGIDQRADAEITLEFGRPVDLEELRLWTRADFPHDSWWERATVTFSDGSAHVLRMEKSARPHSFPLQKRAVTWLKLGELIRADDPSPFPALTQLEVFGRNSL